MSEHPCFARLVQKSRDQSNAPLPDKTPQIPLPLLITGITGVAGYNALAWFQSRFGDQVWGLLPPGTLDFNAPNTIMCNAESPTELNVLFEKIHFASILDCAGNCALKACQLDPKIAWGLNVDIIDNLAKISRRFSIRLVHFSVDMVYGGREGGNYREEEPPCPVNVYGQTMAEGERAVQEEDPFAVTLRISMPMGISFNGHAGAIDWIASRFRKNRYATLYYDEVRTPTYTDCLSRVAHAFLANDYHGLLNAGGPRPVSLYEMAQIINRTGGFPGKLLFGLMKDESCPVPPRVSNCTMNSSRLAEVLGYSPFLPWPREEVLVPSDRRWHDQREIGETGSLEEMYRRLT